MNLLPVYETFHIHYFNVPTRSFSFRWGFTSEASSRYEKTDITLSTKQPREFPHNPGFWGHGERTGCLQEQGLIWRNAEILRHLSPIPTCQLSLPPPCDFRYQWILRHKLGRKFRRWKGLIGLQIRWHQSWDWCGGFDSLALPPKLSNCFFGLQLGSDLFWRSVHKFFITFLQFRVPGFPAVNHHA